MAKAPPNNTSTPPSLQEIQKKIRDLLKNGKTITKQEINHFLENTIQQKPKQDTIQPPNLASVKIRTSQHLPIKTRIPPPTSTPSLQPQKPMKPSMSPREANHLLKNFEPDIKIIKNILQTPGFSGSVDDFTKYFQDRYKKLAKLLRAKQSLPGITTIRNLKSKKDETAIIAMVTSKEQQTNGSYILDVEDLSGATTVIVPGEKTELLQDVNAVLLDSVLGFIGIYRKGVFIANAIIWPDVPYKPHRSRAKLPVNVAFLSDLHVGSKGFIEEPLKKFVDFLNGKADKIQEQYLGQNTKYVLLAGDLVDGVGIYPGQEAELSIDDIQEQYELFSQIFDSIPEDVTVILIPGNHDTSRIAEPQPPIPHPYIRGIEHSERFLTLSNPTLFSLHNVKFLLYHCTPLPNLLNYLPGYTIQKPTQIMKELLKTRHLNPVYGARTPLAPEPSDQLVITELPDIMHGGHVHINDISHYKGIALINSGTMQEQTEFQKSMNIDPTPGKITFVNLQTYEPYLIDFLTT